MFSRYIAILEALAMSPKGATVGQVERLCLQFSRAQITRTLKELITENMVRVEAVYYRPTVNKQVYHLNERAVEYCCYVSRKYIETEHQRNMFIDEKESAQVPA